MPNIIVDISKLKFIILSEGDISIGDNNSITELKVLEKVTEKQHKTLLGLMFNKIRINEDGDIKFD